MSQPLKPFSLPPVPLKQLDSKERKYVENISKALTKFDLVGEWADYIASLGTLLKALQGWSPKFSNVKYYVPYPYEVSRRLTSSLSPYLPAGVHQKTLEVFKYIFENIGLDALAQECNIWIPGILPLMTYASMSVRSTLIDLYDKYLVQLPSTTLKIIIKPLLNSLFPGIDDESSEFLPLTIKLIETLQENLADDSLFWQTCFLIMITNKDRRLGGLVWFTRKFPSLNAVPHLVKELDKKNSSTTDMDVNAKLDNKNEQKRHIDYTLAVLLPAARNLVQPDPGLLIRALVACLDNSNDLLVKRGSLDLLLQRLQLNSPVIQKLINDNDRHLLLTACCKTTFSKDMSLNRRVWNWFLGSTASNNPTEVVLDKSKTKNQSDFFFKFGFKSLFAGLKDLLKEEKNVVDVFKLCLIFMDKWEIGTQITPRMFIPLMHAAELFRDNKLIMKSANTFFDAVETNIIWGNVFHCVIDQKSLGFLNFILSNFHIANDEEIIVRHLPLILLAILSFYQVEEDATVADLSRVEYQQLILEILQLIPERGFLPIINSKLTQQSDIDLAAVVESIRKYYSSYLITETGNSTSKEQPSSIVPPFETSDIAFLLVYSTYQMLIDDLTNARDIGKSGKIFTILFDKIPDHDDKHGKDADDWDNSLLIEKVFLALNNTKTANTQISIMDIVSIYSNYLSVKMSLEESMKLIHLIMNTLWDYMLDSNKQSIAVKCIKLMDRNVSKQYVENCLTSVFVKEQDVTKRLTLLDLLWNQMEDHTNIVQKPLELMLDELFSEQNPSYLALSKWILSLVNSGSSNRLYQIMTNDILQFDFLQKNEINEFDDLDMITYKIQTLCNVLKIDQTIMTKDFTIELTAVNDLERWKNNDVSTYKNLILFIIFEFLAIDHNLHPKSIRSSLVLLDILLDGTEEKFKDYVTFLFELFNKHNGSHGIDSELISVSILDIISKILRLSHKHSIKLDIFDNNSEHLKFIDFMVTSINKIQAPLVVSSYVKLLSETLTYFDTGIFGVLLPLVTTLIQRINQLFEEEKRRGGLYQTISLFLGIVEELIKVSHEYLTSQENEGYFPSNRGEFLQSVVSNVFYSDTADKNVKVQGERDVVLQAFKQSISCVFNIWSWGYKEANKVKELNGTIENCNYNAYKFKFRAKNLLEIMFLLEPLEILETLIMLDSPEEIVTLIHVLDGNKPTMTIPYFFYGLIQRYNKASVAKFSIQKGSGRNTKPDSTLLHKLPGEQLMDFLILYSDSLENSAVEEFYDDFVEFFKDIALNYSLYKSITFKIISFIGIISKKMRKAHFIDHKKFRKEISDVFIKYLPNAVIYFPKAGAYDEEEALTIIEDLVSKTEYVVSEKPGSDRFNNVLTIVVTQCLIPRFKIKNSEKPIPKRCLSLALSITKMGSKVKAWKDFLNDYFRDEKRFDNFGQDPIWDEIVFEWSQYPENKRLLNELLLMSNSKNKNTSPGLIPFASWNDSESTIKLQNLKRTAYLIKVSPQDEFLLDFQPLMECICDYLVEKDVKLKSGSLILLRTMLLKFDPPHFNQYWGIITYCLQINIQSFYESLQLQKDVDNNLTLQLCKTLDLLLLLNFEGFTSTNEWLFIIDTINSVYRNYSFVALIDKVAEFKEFKTEKLDDISLTVEDDKRLPFLLGVHEITEYTQLRKYFTHLSYMQYENVYSLKPIDIEACEKDVLKDIFR